MLTTEEKVALLNDKVLCGIDGGPVPADVSIVERVIFVDNTVKPVLQIQGLAKGYLKNQQDPSQGHEELPEEVPFAVEIDFDRDPQITLKSINQALGLKDDDALVDDGGDWVGRFDPDDKKSIVPLLRSKGVFIKAKAKDEAKVANALKYGDSPWFFNLFTPPKREAASSSNINRIKELLKKKNAAKLGGDGASEGGTSW